MTAVCVDHLPALDRLPALDLAAVERLAALQTRTDRKYVVPAEVADRLVVELGAHVLEIDGRRRFDYRSTYFDTPGRDAYLAAARRRPGRWKVRTRHYVDSGATWLEVKQRDRRGRTVKLRCPHRGDVLDGAAHDYLAGFPVLTPLVEQLAPALTTSYERATLVLDGARVTVDHDVTCTTADGRSVTVDGVVVETKSARAGCTADRLLWSLGHRPVTISKYGVGMAALHPELPANKWRRTLDRHVRPV